MQEHIDAAKVIGGQVNFLAEEATLNVVLTQNLFYLQQQRTRTTGRVYVPTDFDTIEKAFSGVKTAKKGTKQGLSRSNADFGSPCLLYSIEVKPLGNTGGVHLAVCGF